MALRAWTSGIDLCTPAGPPVVLHQYGRSGRSGFVWDDDATFLRRNHNGVMRLRELLEGTLSSTASRNSTWTSAGALSELVAEVPGVGRTIEWLAGESVGNGSGGAAQAAQHGRYSATSLGSERSLAEYSAYSGVDYSARLLLSRAKAGNPFALRTARELASIGPGNGSASNPSEGLERYLWVGEAPVEEASVRDAQGASEAARDRRYVVAFQHTKGYLWEELQLTGTDYSELRPRLADQASQRWLPGLGHFAVVADWLEVVDADWTGAYRGSWVGIASVLLARPYASVAAVEAGAWAGNGTAAGAGGGLQLLLSHNRAYSRRQTGEEERFDPRPSNYAGWTDFEPRSNGSWA